MHIRYANLVLYGPSYDPGEITYHYGPRAQSSIKQSHAGNKLPTFLSDG